MGKYSAVMSMFASNILDFLRLPVFKDSVNKFFIHIFKDVVAHRIKENVVRNDFINSLMDITNCEQDIEESSTTTNAVKSKSCSCHYWLSIFF